MKIIMINTTLEELQEVLMWAGSDAATTVIDTEPDPLDDLITDIAVLDGVDINGKPWDERIHSSNHKKTADGLWVKRRGVDPLTYQQVYDSLPGLTDDKISEGDVVTIMSEESFSQAILRAEPPEPPEPPVPPVPVDPQAAWKELVAKITARKPSNESIQTACAALGITLPALITQQDLIPAFEAIVWPELDQAA